jgi:hypothetical protein
MVEGPGERLYPSVQTVMKLLSAESRAAMRSSAWRVTATGDSEPAR